MQRDRIPDQDDLGLRERTFFSPSPDFAAQQRGVAEVLVAFARAGVGQRAVREGDMARLRSQLERQEEHLRSVTQRLREFAKTNDLPAAPGSALPLRAWASRRSQE
jgi:hypothetical protein